MVCGAHAGASFWRDGLEKWKLVNVENNHILVADGSALKLPETNGAWETIFDGAHTNGDAGINIRPYKSSDRAMICRLCCESGFLGGPVDPLFEDRELFAELFTRAYLKYETDWAFVAEDHKHPIGYLLGSVRPRFEMLLLESGLRTTTKILLRLASGRYRSPRTRTFIRWLLTAGFLEQPRHPRGAAHLHLQVEKSHRARGVGRRLWEHYEARLREIGMKQCYGSFFSRPTHRPERAYGRYGFEVFDRRRTTLFEPEIREQVEVVCVSKTL
jgi:GNAT superfamily N-acetyltransferase